MYDVAVTTGLTYRKTGDQSLMADLYLPATQDVPPVVLYVHGGGFQTGSRTDDSATRLAALAAYGIAVFSVDYRLAPGARFPDQLHDVRAAVRWLRTHATHLGVDGARMAIWGASAGGLLASLAGLSIGSMESEEIEDQRGSVCSAVQAVVTWFGLADLVDTASRSWLEAELLPFNFEAAFLGVESVTTNAEDGLVADRARRASPLTWVSSDAPPFLISHGDRDRITPVAQSQALHDSLVRAGANSTLQLIGGAGHEDRAFESPANLAMTAGWLLATLNS